MFLSNTDLLLVANCFPLLKELNLKRPLVIDETNFINGIRNLLSKCQCIQHLNLDCIYFLKDQHVVELSFYMGNLVSISLNDCYLLAETTLFSLVRNCPSLSEIQMQSSAIGEESLGHSDSLVEFGVYPQLKSLYLGYTSWLSDEIIIMFASIFPNLKLLDLKGCHQIFDGICHVLRKCRELKHLNLAYCEQVKLRAMNF
ncbi:putative leucine-rich repeat domain, L domain-containing protein [Medicago truncatula]|uniref:Putative leucine-rich repeat domain, L domain-containing protein n=1 Tax=Medicago truncatula TaxID=3880 RepID=A0A396HCR4_MEDTR|nr:putative leucine-rich repeat domain, L domain-containing protein [Medicago truncatula]